MTSDITSGISYPLGASLSECGVNFSVYSKSCERIDLLLFDSVDDARPSRVIALDRHSRHQTFHYWHVFVAELEAGQVYGYRAHGALAPDTGLRADSEKVLLDPYGRCVAIPAAYDRDAAARPGDNTPYAMKSIVCDIASYNWEGDVPLRTPFAKTVIYEMHVRGFTRHPGSGVKSPKRGTYAGLIEKIPYLQDLGITAVELLPIFQFDPQEAMPGLTNYWGYNPVSFFAPHAGYSSDPSPMAALNEFRDMVKALHRAGIEVILDVVYNHTAEGNEAGPTFCFKGLDNPVYYILERDSNQYANYTGCGNTLNGNHAVVRRMILDSLRYWVEEMHVDGFRFDLASVLSRDTEGHPLANPPILWDIETDPVLSGTKLIAEAWDAAGLYQVGDFFGDHWKEWNGRFRDDVRAFVKGDDGFAKAISNRFLASPDLYGHRDLEPEQTINFVTCHDGFTLNDLVSYNGKHNRSNGEENRDGSNDNISWNCGVEGPSDDPDIEAIRSRQIKNLLTINILALGVPMLLMGDEVRRTQLGNNNAYCQDNEISWFDWTLLEQHRDLHRFVKNLITLYRQLPARRVPRLNLSDLLLGANIRWHGTRLDRPDWSHTSHSLAFEVETPLAAFFLMLNAFHRPLEFELPVPDALHPAPWHRVIDTSLESPHDIHQLTDAPVHGQKVYAVESRSVVILARPFMSITQPDITPGESSSSP